MGKDQESIQSSTTPDPGYQWECDKSTVNHHKQELSQQVTTMKQLTDAKTLQKQDINNTNDPQKK